MSPQPKVSVSILAFRDMGTIGACVESVVNLEYGGPLEIFIRGQGDDDEQLRVIEQATKGAGSRPVTIRRGDNIGFAPGHNTNIRVSDGDFQLLVNADARLEPNFLVEAMKHFDDPRVGS